jgi:hypothetical protein
MFHPHEMNEKVSYIFIPIDAPALECMERIDEAQGGHFYRRLHTLIQLITFLTIHWTRQRITVHAMRLSKIEARLWIRETKCMSNVLFLRSAAQLLHNQLWEAQSRGYCSQPAAPSQKNEASGIPLCYFPKSLARILEPGAYNCLEFRLLASLV